jgi:arsenate reductase
MKKQKVNAVAMQMWKRRHVQLKKQLAANMFPAIKSFCDHVARDFDKIPGQRKELLGKISDHIIKKKKEGEVVNLVYICTHNSRRSHFGQVWAKIASAYYGIKGVNTFSGGTEVSAFNINAINALERIGFEVKSTNSDKNSVYHVAFDEKESPIICFSKTYDDPKNPQKDFAAVITCSDAEENCPFIPTVELRVGTTYDDPKFFDGTSQQEEKYSERCRQIALETLYVFSKVK